MGGGEIRSSGLDGMASATAFCDDSPSAYMFNDLSGMRQFSFFLLSRTNTPSCLLSSYVGMWVGLAVLFLVAYFIWPCPTRWFSIVPVGGLVGVIRPRVVVGGFGVWGVQHIPHLLLCRVERAFSFFFVFTGSKQRKNAWHGMA